AAAAEDLGVVGAGPAADHDRVGRPAPGARERFLELIHRGRPPDVVVMHILIAERLMTGPRPRPRGAGSGRSRWSFGVAPVLGGAGGHGDRAPPPRPMGDPAHPPPVHRLLVRRAGPARGLRPREQRPQPHPTPRTGRAQAVPLRLRDLLVVLVGPGAPLVEQ